MFPDLLFCEPYESMGFGMRYYPVTHVLKSVSEMCQCSRGWTTFCRLHGLIHRSQSGERLLNGWSFEVLRLGRWVDRARRGAGQLLGMVKVVY
jgi:hypothetical protein